MSFITKVKTHRHILINVVVASVFFVGGYFTHGFVAGTQRPGNMPADGNFSANTNGAPSMSRGDGAGGVPSSRITTGTIVSNSGSYITIKLSSGSTKNVYISDSTTVYSRTKTTADQLVADKTVSVQGETNSDNSIAGITITVQ